MHKESYNACKSFMTKYLDEKTTLNILDVGSMDLNGSASEIFKNKTWKYTGMDLEPGQNVDIVCNPGENFPFEDNFFDVCISSSAFEHDKAFWVTFNEMVRVVKKNGLIYINTPSSGRVHRYPLDCWRFYPDAYIALESWNKKVKLIESYIDETSVWWNDNVGIFRVLN